MKEEASLASFPGKTAILGEVTVGGIADDREATFLALDPELVCSSSVGGEFEQGQNGNAGDDLELAHFACGGIPILTGVGAELAALFLHLKTVFPEFLAASRHAKNEGEIGLFDVAGVKTATQFGG